MRKTFGVGDRILHLGGEHAESFLSYLQSSARSTIEFPHSRKKTKLLAVVFVFIRKQAHMERLPANSYKCKNLFAFIL